MEDGLVAKMKELDADSEKMEERLDPEMQRELCFAVLCERMDRHNYREEEYFDVMDSTCAGMYRLRHVFGYKPKEIVNGAVRYDPKLAFEFIMSGKEQFQAFMDVCKSLKNLEVQRDHLALTFNKNVCMTESDPKYYVDNRTFQLLDSFFVKKFLKHARRLDVSSSKGKCSEFFYSHLTEIQNLEELEIQGSFENVGQLANLLKVNPLRSIEADWGLFKEFDGGVTDYKLEKMLISDCCKIEDVFQLSNFYPKELRLRLPDHSFWEDVPENKAFAEVVKLSIFKDHRTDPAHTLFVRLHEMLSFAEQFIDLVKKHFPKMEELVFGFRIFELEELDLDHPENQFKVFTDLCSDFVKKYQKTFKVRFVLCWWDRIYSGLNVHEYMKKQLPNQKYQVVDEIGLTNCIWENRCNLSEAVVLDYYLSISLDPWLFRID